MDLDLEENGAVSILVLRGQLVGTSANSFREAMDTLIESSRLKILLDFTELSFMDSGGIGELVSGYRTMDRLGGELKILKPGKRIQDTLTLTKLLPIFEVFEDRDTAIASFSGD
jgi:anti-sigma B factor antagonist